MRLVLGIDVGTSNVKSRVIDEAGRTISSAVEPVTLESPRPGWVEQDPRIIYDAVLKSARRAIERANGRIEAVGVTNQRSTVIAWRKDGTPIYNAITWMDTRGWSVREVLRKELEETFQVLEPFLQPNASSMFLRWILDNVEGAREKAEKGDVIFGTVDSYVVWRLTDGKTHATDASNASATGMLEPFSAEWFNDMIEVLKIPTGALPEVRDTIGYFGEASELPGSPPILSVAGDQMAALFGEARFTRGDAKVSHGTGSFVDVNMGGEFQMPTKGLIPLIAWKIKGKPTYMMEGFISCTGSAVDWAIEVGLAKDYEDVERAGAAVEGSYGIVFVPALTGLTSPHMDLAARGGILGISRGARREHILRALIEGIAHLTVDVIEVFREDLGIGIDSIRADGGLSKSDLLLQLTADYGGLTVERAADLDSTVLGIALMASFGAGILQSLDEVSKVSRVDATFKPRLSGGERAARRSAWRKALERVKGWEEA